MEKLKFLQKTKDIWGMAVNTALPPRCPLTGEVVESQGMTSPAAWSTLRFIGAPLCASCGIPFDFQEESAAAVSDLRCATCLADPPPFQSARAALVYDDASRDLILRYKHADHLHAVHAFVPWLRRVGSAILARADLLVPVPLHRWRLLRRRYNQAAILAQALGREANIACLPDGLLRIKSTPPQGHMNITERRKNVSNAFAVNPVHRAAISGKTIVLIDDVYTTGATATACAETLLAAGAARVDVLAIARVVRS